MKKSTLEGRKWAAFLIVVFLFIGYLVLLTFQNPGLAGTLGDKLIDGIIWVTLILVGGVAATDISYNLANRIMKTPEEKTEPPEKNP